MSEIDLSNPSNLIYLFLSTAVLIITISLFYQAYVNFHCEEFINQRDTCYEERDSWKEKTISLNKTIENCTNLIQEQIDICDERINESTQSCETEKRNALDLIFAYKVTFVFYHILVLALWLPLTINLYKIKFKIGLKKEWEEKFYWWKKGLLIVKIIGWILVSLIILFYLILYFISNPITP